MDQHLSCTSNCIALPILGSRPLEAGAPLEDCNFWSYVRFMLTVTAAGYTHHHGLLDTFIHSAMWRFGSIVMTEVVHQWPVVVPAGIGLGILVLVSRGTRWLRRRG